jgi:hypothetical protein
MWQDQGLHPYNRNNPADVALESQANVELDTIRGSWKKCRKH